MLLQAFDAIRQHFSSDGNKNFMLSAKRGRKLAFTPTHRRLRLEWYRAQGKWTAVEWNQEVLSDKSRFNFSNDDNSVQVWRPRGDLSLLYSDTPLAQLV
ncbi:hypothetical protein TNCV_3039711 [Trichonephila clavipes]|uniref:Uncharacterized protein n=1 Tax=Trichonephila clavipes TaxID=2585209 RepID=A0A8X6V053_TRICX|nr:hypothetical protein TNCV_3039711 [Trichonephila clavipes]